MSAARWWVMCVLVSGCASVTPLQMASVIAEGHTVVGGQVSASLFCGSVADGPVGALSCNQYPDGIPLPELRANVRRGVGWASDVGGSIQVLGQIGAPEKVLQVGATLDVKRELLHVSSPSGLAHVLSLGAVGGTAITGRLGLTPLGQVEWTVPLRYGLLTQHTEWVATVLMSQRYEFGGRSEVRPFSSLRVGASLGVFRKDPIGWGVQLGYLTDPAKFGFGSIQLQVGWQWDLG